MSELSIVQRIARIIGKDGGPNSFFKDATNPADNRGVYTMVKPRLETKALGCVELADLPHIAKARIQTWFSKREVW